MSTNGVSVLPIIGIRGVGKTTFAQLVHSDLKVKNHFDIEDQICISKYFDVFRIIKTIVQSISIKVVHDNNLN